MRYSASFLLLHLCTVTLAAEVTASSRVMRTRRPDSNGVGDNAIISASGDINLEGAQTKDETHDSSGRGLMLSSDDRGGKEESAAAGAPELSLLRKPELQATARHTFGSEKANEIINSTQRGSRMNKVTMPRKIGTVNLALSALSVPGDFVETGVYTGGTAVLLAKVLKTEDTSRKLWAADSFEGLPEESPVERARAKTEDKVGGVGWYSSSRKVFEKNLEVNGLGNSTTNPQIQVLQGWFKDTLPTAPIKRIAFLRLDGDLYVSTKDAISSLYDKVVPGGYIYVDDYGSFPGCKHAIDEFRKAHGIVGKMFTIPEEDGHFDALWWRKE